MITWIVFFGWLAFVLWLAIHPQGIAKRNEWWSWLNPWDFSKGMIDGNAMREEEEKNLRATAAAEKALADAETRRKAHKRNMEALTGQPDFASFIPQSRPGIQIRQHEDINTNSLKIQATEGNRTSSVSICQMDLRNLAPEERKLLVAQKIDEAISKLMTTPVLGEVGGGVSVTPEEYTKKFAPNGKHPMSPEDHLVAEILGTRADDYNTAETSVEEIAEKLREIRGKDAEFEAGH